jgi:dTDP-4-amino-4,6-dideoxygalactose transaminase
MDRIIELGRQYGIAVVEDNAHGTFGKYRGQYLGTFGGLAALSFHETKNFICGEGGALLINDPEYVSRAEIIREKGTDRSRFFRGLVDKYSWVDIGSSYLPSDLLAAFLYAQLEAREKVLTQRRHIWEYYYENLQPWAMDRNVKLPDVPAVCEQAYHMFYLLLPSLQHRESFMAHLKERGILSVFHYQPLHLSGMGRQLGGRAGDCPVTEDISDRLVRLPFYNDLSDGDLAYVVAAIKEWKLAERART